MVWSIVVCLSMMIGFRSVVVCIGCMSYCIDEQLLLLNSLFPLDVALSKFFMILLLLSFSLWNREASMWIDYWFERELCFLKQTLIFNNHCKRCRDTLEWIRIINFPCDNWHLRQLRFPIKLQVWTLFIFPLFILFVQHLCS